MENAPERCTEQEIKIHKLNQQILDQLEATNVETEQVENEKSQIDGARFKMGSFPKAIAKLLRLYEANNQTTSDPIFRSFRIKKNSSSTEAPVHAILSEKGTRKVTGQLTNNQTSQQILKVTVAYKRMITHVL